MKVRLNPKAKKQLEKLDRQVAERLAKGIKKLEKEPMEGDIEPVTEIEGAFRLRVGDYRILFEVVCNEVHVFKIKGRDKAYK